MPRMLLAFELDAVADRRTSTYSGGQRRRLDVALGIDPPAVLLFLDEPTTGLDPQARARLWDEVRRLRDVRHVRVPDHPLPGRGRRPVRPGGHHRPRRASWPRARPLELKRQVAGDVVTIGVDGDPAATCWRSSRASRSCARRPWTTATSALYVENGDAALPQLLRILDGAGMARQPPSRCTAPASTTCSCARPAAPCASRQPDPTQPPDPIRKDPPMKTVRDTWLIFQRSLMLTLRNPVWIFVGLTQPLFFLVLFGPLLKVARRGRGMTRRDCAYNLFVPGLLIQLGAVRRHLRRLRPHRRAARRASSSGCG